MKIQLGEIMSSVFNQSDSSPQILWIKLLSSSRPCYFIFYNQWQKCYSSGSISSCFDLSLSLSVAVCRSFPVFSIYCFLVSLFLEFIQINFLLPADLLSASISGITSWGTDTIVLYMSSICWYFFMTYTSSVQFHFNFAIGSIMSRL